MRRPDLSFGGRISRTACICLIAMLLVTALTAGCGSASGSGSGAAASDQNEGTPVTLDVWYSASGQTGEAFLKEAAAFDDQSALIDLSLSYSGSSDDTAYKVNAALLAGNGPDVALMYAGTIFTGGRGDFTMDELIKRESFDASDLYPGLRDFCRYYSDERLCAVPYGVSTQLIYYNRSLIENAGIDLTEPPKTWDAFKESLTAVQETLPEGCAAFDAVQADWLFKTMLHQAGSPLVTSNGQSVAPAFTDEGAVRAAAFWQSLADEGLMPRGEHAAAEDRFLSGKLAFLAMSSNRIPRWEDAAIQIGAIPVPSFGAPSTAVGGTVLVILTDDRQKVEAAWDLISYLLEPEHHASFALASGYLPVRQSELALPQVREALSDNELYRTAYDQLEDAWSYTYFDDMGLLNLTIDEVLDFLERSGRDPKEILDAASEKLSEEFKTGE